MNTNCSKWRFSSASHDILTLIREGSQSWGCVSGSRLPVLALVSSWCLVADFEAMAPPKAKLEVPKYKTGQDIEDYLKVFELIVDASGLTAEQKKTQFLISFEIGTLYHRLIRDVRGDGSFADVKARLISTFKGKFAEFDSMIAFKKRVQLRTECHQAGHAPQHCQAQSQSVRSPSHSPNGNPRQMNQRQMGTPPPQHRFSVILGMDLLQNNPFILDPQKHALIKRVLADSDDDRHFVKAPVPVHALYDFKIQPAQETAIRILNPTQSNVIIRKNQVVAEFAEVGGDIENMWRGGKRFSIGISHGESRNTKMFQPTGSSIPVNPEAYLMPISFLVVGHSFIERAMAVAVAQPDRFPRL
ncbi:unnamed protein product [Darwinula stevensoni]|uniref:Uncharacterized protein n=1 Tax=Darwinula stevensoni TaxID=69355 RepID=A0A7R8XEM0_9CRUS|nr:unnamed protein product [Darwinula stevensoni]CAG0895432.1 unnamed protein product [Darwinula stevensoni]